MKKNCPICKKPGRCRNIACRKKTILLNKAARCYKQKIIIQRKMEEIFDELEIRRRKKIPSTDLIDKNYKYSKILTQMHINFMNYIYETDVSDSVFFDIDSNGKPSFFIPDE